MLNNRDINNNMALHFQTLALLLALCWSPVHSAAFFELAGVASIGQKALKLPVGNLPPAAFGASRAWSMTFWLWLAHEPGYDPSAGAVRSNNVTDGRGPYEASFRTLFFHGPGGDSQDRTPSAWIDPLDGRLAIRASKVLPSYDPDVGASTVSALPVRKWTQVTFVFTNHSFDEGSRAFSGGGSDYLSPQGDGNPPQAVVLESSSASDIIYSIELYLNDALDSRLDYRGPGLIGANEGPLWLGKDETFAGATGLLYGLKLYDGALTHDDVIVLYAQSAP